MVKFKIGTSVNKSGFKGVVTKIRGTQREVKLPRGEAVVDVSDLKHWKKKVKRRKK